MTTQEAEDRIKQELSTNEEYKKKWMNTLAMNMMMCMPITIVGNDTGVVMNRRDQSVYAREVAERWVGKFVEGDREYEDNEYKRRQVEWMNRPQPVPKWKQIWKILKNK